MNGNVANPDEWPILSGASKITAAHDYTADMAEVSRAWDKRRHAEIIEGVLYECSLGLACLGGLTSCCGRVASRSPTSTPGRG